MAVSGDDENQVAASLLRRAVISLIDDAKALAVAQVKLLDDEPEDAELFQGYGWAANPPVGSEAIVIRIGGVPEHQIVISTALRGKRPKVAEGEVKIWVADGPLIHLTDSEIRLGDGATKEVARKGDANLIDAATDAVFIAPGTGWVSLVSAFINGIAPGTITAVPTSVVGKVNAGSGTVKAVD